MSKEQETPSVQVARPPLRVRVTGNGLREDDGAVVEALEAILAGSEGVIGAGGLILVLSRDERGPAQTARRWADLRGIEVVSEGKADKALRFD